MQKKKGKFAYNPAVQWIKRAIAVFFITACAVNVHASPKDVQTALDKKVSVDFKNVSLKDALIKLEHIANISLSYVDNATFNAEKVTLSFKNEKVSSVLSKVLTPYYFNYTIVDDHIVIWYDGGKSAKPKAAATAVTHEIIETAFFQPVNIKGVVTSEKQVPLPGVSVQIKGTAKGVITNEKGEFEIHDVSDNAILVFTIAGYKTQEVAVKNVTDELLKIQLKEEAANLQDVVVTGFQNIDKKKFAGAAVRLNADSIKTDGVIDVSRMLEGRAAGVSVQNVSGTFGTAPKIRIRGATSINGDNKPLWVVDGVVLEDVVNISNDQLSSGDPSTLLGSSVAGLNANDIESFDILKDAAATALYGARAMNGVVVITTKKGRIGKPVINYTGNFSTQLKPSYKNFDIMNSAQQMDVLVDMYNKGFLKPNMANNSEVGVFGKMYQLLNTIDANGNFALDNSATGPLSQSETNYLLRYANANTDWFDVLFRNNFMQEHSLSITSGTDKSQSYFSMSYYGDDGWTVADNVKRYTLNFNNNYKFSDKVSTRFSTLGSVRQQRTPGALDRQPNPVEGQEDRDFDINPFNYALTTSRTLTAFDSTGKREYFTKNFAPFNILTEEENNYENLSILDLRLQGELTWKITHHLRYDFIGALRYVKSNIEHIITENSNMANAYRADQNATIAAANRFLYRDPDNPDAPPVVVLPYGGFYNTQDDQLVNYDFRNSLTYTQTFGKHYINFLAGQEVKYADRQQSFNTGYGYQYDNGGVPFTDPTILKETISQDFPYFGMTKYYDRFVAFYATGNYTFNNKINLTATTRYDGSNQLGLSTTARWLPTWSVAGSWNMERESFLQNVKWLDYLTLRASYGLTASMGPATNSTLVLNNTLTQRPHLSEQESVIEIAHLQNDQLTWEKNYTGDVGFDAGFLNHRLNVVFDVYNRKSFDLISLIKTSGIGGEVMKAANYANLTSQGIEATLGWDVVRKKDWGWKTNVTFGYNTNKITNAKNDPIIYDLVVPEGGNKEGYPVRSLFSIQYKQLDPVSGYPKFIDESGNINANVNLQSDQVQYLKYEGPVDPPYTGGFNNTFRYKAFSLNFFISYQFGNKIRMRSLFKSAYSDLDAMPKEFFDRWMMPGDEKATSVPSIIDGLEATAFSGAYPYNNYNYSTERVAKGDMVRLKTVSLNYQLPAAFIHKIGLTNVSLGINALNMWLIYSDKKLKGQDPEFFNAGGVAQPIQKQFTLSLKVGI
jgi:TonB-linked SusC/RagA family outer membrane protein